MEGPLIHEMEARLVAVEKAELGSGGQFAKCGGHAGEFAFFGPVFHTACKQAVFDGPGTAQAPVGGGHFLDHAEFDIIDRAEAVQMEIEQGLEGFAGFTAKDDAPGEETMTGRISGGTGLALIGLGAAGPGSIRAGGEDAFLRNHVLPLTR